MPTDPIFDVFLCHNTTDKSSVELIGRRLKQHGIRPWLDIWELQPGLPWQRLLERQIGSIKSAAVFVGASGLGPWQSQELGTFLSEFVDRGCPVIPTLLDSAPASPDLPLFLRNMMWVDFRRPTPDPLMQLIGGITGRKHHVSRRRGKGSVIDLVTAKCILLLGWATNPSSVVRGISLAEIAGIIGCENNIAMVIGLLKHCHALGLLTINKWDQHGAYVTYPCGLSDSEFFEEGTLDIQPIELRRPESVAHETARRKSSK